MKKNKNFIKKFKEEENGITLIVLAITICVMAILIGITVNYTIGKNGILSQSEQVKANIEAAKDEGQQIIDKIKSNDDGSIIDGAVSKEDTEAPISDGVEITNVTESSFTVNLNVTETNSGIKSVKYSIDNGTTWNDEERRYSYTFRNVSPWQTAYNVQVKTIDEAGNENTYTDSLPGVRIPDGFVWVGGTKDSGLVISDATADKEKYKGQDDVGKDLEGNQWVWVPVETPSSLYTTVAAGQALAGSTGVKTTKYTNSAIISGKTRGLPGDTSSSREPDLVLGSDGKQYDYANYATAGFSSLANMAETMKSDYEEMIASLEKYKGFYIGRYELTANGEKTGATQTDVNWYTLYKNCTTLAVGSKVKTRMIWGLQWDATCKWLATSNFDITNSSTWGNYYDNDATGHGSLQNTGFSESWKANNIYDFAGNCYEFTQEASGTFYRAGRGGYCGLDGSGYPASGRSDRSPTSTSSVIGSRPTLYLIP